MIGGNKESIDVHVALKSPSVQVDTKEMKDTKLVTPNIYGLCIIHEVALYTSHSAWHSFVLHRDMKLTRRKN